MPAPVPPPSAAPVAPAAGVRRGWLGTGLLLLAFTLAQGAWAVHLNRVFYERHGPFYDSVSYLERLADLLHTAQDQGVLPALRQSTVGSTVFLPFGFVPAIGRFVSLDRAVGVWLLCPFVLLCTASLVGYLVRHRGARPSLAVALAVLFVSLHAVYFWAGGLSDFRVDLSFSLLFSATIIRLLSALRERTLGAWALFGGLAGLTCLARATTPVFLVLTCVPMVLPELFAGRARLLAALRGAALAAALCLLLAGWFYVLNWPYLHYYYFIWNLDANARLPLAMSIQHLRFAADSAGPVVLGTAGLCTALALVDRFLTARRTGAGRPVLTWLGEIEWRAAALALVPVGYLVLSGAGPNGLVSLPSAFGFVLFVLALAGRWPAGGWAARAIPVVALAGAAWSAHRGLEHHRVGPGSANPVSAYATVADTIVAQAPTIPRSEIRVSHFSLGTYHDYALTSYFLYDRHAPGRGGRVQLGAQTILIEGLLRFSPPTKVNWDQLPGADDEQRLQHIVDSLNRESDLVVMPTASTAEQLAVRIPGNYINLFVGRIRERLLATGRWEPVSAVFRASYWEEDYCVMRNRLR